MKLIHYEIIELKRPRSVKSKGDVMIPKIKTLSTAAFLSFILSGCVSKIRESIEADHIYYQRAISDAAVIESDEVIDLPLIKESKVKVVIWTNKEYLNSYHVGKYTETKWGTTWVTLDNAVRNKCLYYDQASITKDLQKLLGLPPKNEERIFVTLEVNADSLFRPCSDPSILNSDCSSEFPENVPDEHKLWFAEKTQKSYNMESGFPWTRLGYTYNWNHNESEFGLAEFVIKKNSKVLTLAITDTLSYCSQ